MLDASLTPLASRLVRPNFNGPGMEGGGASRETMSA